MAQLAHSAPPTGAPPILLTIDYADASANVSARPRPNVHVTGGALQLTNETPLSNEGFAAGEEPFRDVIVQARLALLEGDSNDLYGVFVRQASNETHYTFTVSPTGQCVIAQYAGQYMPVVNGNLAPDMTFHHGLGAPNLFQVVACGPSLTFVLNDKVVTGVMVDPRYKEGYLGFFVHHGPSSARAVVAAEWIQVRAIFPGQRARED